MKRAYSAKNVADAKFRMLNLDGRWAAAIVSRRARIAGISRQGWRVIYSQNGK